MATWTGLVNQQKSQENLFLNIQAVIAWPSNYVYSIIRGHDVLKNSDS